jgi:hypothetical protein
LVNLLCELFWDDLLELRALAITEQKALAGMAALGWSPVVPLTDERRGLVHINP